MARKAFDREKVKKLIWAVQDLQDKKAAFIEALTSSLMVEIIALSKQERTHFDDMLSCIERGANVTTPKQAAARKGRPKGAKNKPKADPAPWEEAPHP